MISMKTFFFFLTRQFSFSQNWPNSAFTNNHCGGGGNHWLKSTSENGKTQAGMVYPKNNYPGLVMVHFQNLKEYLRNNEFSMPKKKFNVTKQINY